MASRLRIMWAVLALVLALLPLGSRPRAEGAVVEALMFYSSSCPHCHTIMDEFLPPLQEKYGDSLQVEFVSIDDAMGYRMLMYLDELAGVPPDRRGVPEMIVGSQIMIGSGSIQENLPRIIEEGLAAGGIETITGAELRRMVEEALPTAAPATPATAATATATPIPIYLAYIFQPGCQECDRADYDLRLLQETYPQVVVERYSAVDDAALAEWLGERYRLPEEKRLTAPAVFLGEEHLLGGEVNFAAMQGLVERYAASGASRAWEGWEADRDAAESRVLGRFRSFGLATVMAAGLIDGVNPCAFATLVFFVSYLTVTGRARRQILATGAAFTLAVFLTYFLIGLGLFRVLSVIPALSVAAKVIYGLTAAACLVLAGISLQDYLKARRGKTGDMALRLPTRLRKWVNRSIRESMAPGTAVAAAFTAGVVVSVVELACTGQVYLPTLMFVAAQPDLRANAVGALAAYNTAFVLPLIVVFALAAYGVGSEHLRGLLARHTSTVKLLTTLLFLGLAAWLLMLIL